MDGMEHDSEKVKTFELIMCLGRGGGGGISQRAAENNAHDIE
jgi:hypothetical protein